MNAWSQSFALAVLQFGLSPDAFWSLSMPEWRALLDAAVPQGDAPSKADLQALLQHYPDKD